MKVATDVATRDAQLRAHERQRDVCKVLAHAGTGGQRLIEGRIRPRGMGLVRDHLRELAIQGQQRGKGIFAPFHPELPGEFHQLGGWQDVVAGQQHLPEVAPVHLAVQVVPG